MPDQNRVWTGGRTARPPIDLQGDTVMMRDSNLNGRGRWAGYDDDRSVRSHARDDEHGQRWMRDDDHGHDEGRGRYDDDRGSDRDEHMGSRTMQRNLMRQRAEGTTCASVWEITAQSPESFEDAIRIGIARARRTTRHIQGAWVQGQEVVLRNGDIYAYRVQLKLTYLLDDR
jgi:flavin-binding protein dodecin